MDRHPERWPDYQGEYVLGDQGSPVAILIIGRGAVDVPTELFCVKGIMKTENVGLEKVVLNIVANPRIRFLVICGKEEFGHFPADAILKLVENGLDHERRIIGARSAIPFLCSLPIEAVDRFREQVELVDLVHPKDSMEIVAMDPIYQFEPERRLELIETVKGLPGKDPGPYPGEPMRIMIPGLMNSSDRLGHDMHRTADVIIENMLCMPSERLRTDSAMAVISDELGLAVDPVSGTVFQVPNVELAKRMRMYFTGC
jgi:tetrahydromethanopterin S-methyltransferase subunit A